jgi:capsular exopolysaccharide synthesis family protein
MDVENKSLERILKYAGSMEGLQGSLLSAAKGNAVKSLLVTSGKNREGKSTVAIGLAAALARDATVLLVDGNLNRPVLADLFNVPSSPGLTDVLGGADLDQAVQQTTVSGLSLLPAGSGGSILKQLEKLPQQLQALYSKFDCIVFDGDSTLTSSEAALLAKQVDGVVLVAECEQTKREIITLCQEKLAALGGNVLGVVLNRRQFYIPGALYGKV